MNFRHTFCKFVFCLTHHGIDFYCIIHILDLHNVTIHHGKSLFRNHSPADGCTRCKCDNTDGNILRLADLIFGKLSYFSTISFSQTTVKHFHISMTDTIQFTQFLIIRIMRKILLLMLENNTGNLPFHLYNICFPNSILLPEIINRQFFSCYHVIEHQNS